MRSIELARTDPEEFMRKRRDAKTPEAIAATYVYAKEAERLNKKMGIPKKKRSDDKSEGSLKPA